MHGVRFEIHPAALILFALVYCFDSLGLVAAVLPAALLHEFGHYLALRLCGGQLSRIGIGFFGLEMDYAGTLTAAEEAACAAAGPLAGVIYAACAAAVGGRYFRMSGTVSVLLSAFNLLPALPLDGGRIAAALLRETAARRISRAAAVLLLCFGAVLALRREALTPLLMGAWLTFHNFRA